MRSLTHVRSQSRSRLFLFAIALALVAVFGANRSHVTAQTPNTHARLPFAAIEAAAGSALVGHTTLPDGTVIPLFDHDKLDHTPGFSHKLLAAPGGKGTAEAIGHTSTKLDYNPLKKSQPATTDAPATDYGHNYAYLYGQYYNNVLYYIYSVGVSAIDSGYGSVYTYVATNSTFGSTPVTQGNFGFRLLIANSFQNVASTAVSGFLPEQPGACYWGVDDGTIYFTDWPYAVHPYRSYTYTYCSY